MTGLEQVMLLVIEEATHKFLQMDKAKLNTKLKFKQLKRNKCILQIICLIQFTASTTKNIFGCIKIK